MNFTVVCYRPNGVDTCRGCVMATSDSSFEILHEQTEEACASAITTKRMENRESEREQYDRLQAKFGGHP